MIGLLIFIGAFILIFVAGWLNNTPLMTMSFLLVLLSAAGLVTTAVSLALVRVTAVEWTGRAEKGLTGAVRVRLSKRISPALAPYISIRYRIFINNVKQKGSVRAPLYGGSVIELPFVGTECGLLCLSVRSLRVTDLFGWFSLAKPCRLTFELPVLPDDSAEETESIFPQTGEEAVGSRAEAASRGTAVRDISSYRPDDEARAIHWPASARLGVLMKKFLLRLPAQLLQSACLFAAAFCMLRVFARIPFFTFDMGTVLLSLAYVLTASAVAGAIRKSTGTVTLLGMLLVLYGFFFAYRDDVAEQAVVLYKWAVGELSGRQQASEVTLYFLTLVLLVVLFVRLFTRYRGTAFVLLAAYIAFVIAMPEAKIALSAADVLPGIAAIILLFFAAQMERTEGDFRTTLKVAGWRRNYSQQERQETKSVRLTETVPYHKQALQLLLACGIAAAALIILLLRLRHYYRTLRPAKAGKAFERRYGKIGRASGTTGLRIESRDFAARAAEIFSDIPEADFAAFRAAVLSDAYNTPADEDTAEKVRDFYRRLIRPSH